jgi:hypothetical protein
MAPRHSGQHFAEYGARVLLFNCDDVVTGLSLRQNVLLETGDEVIVP